MSEEINQPEERKLSPEEIAQRRKDLIQFYQNQVKLLAEQEKYEKVLADIEEHRLRRLVAMARQGQIMAPETEPEETPQEQEEAPKKERVLRKS